MGKGQKQQAKRGLPLRTGKRKAKHAAYYEVTYPFRKLLRMYKDGASIKLMRLWADNYRTASGSSGNAALVRLAKLHGLNVSQQ
jgi:hypothetical protein